MYANTRMFWNFWDQVSSFLDITIEIQNLRIMLDQIAARVMEIGFE